MNDKKYESNEQDNDEQTDTQPKKKRGYQRKNKTKEVFEKLKRIAFSDYMNGMSLRDIAKRRNISLRTLDSWTQKNNWTQIKGVHEKKIQDSVFLQLADTIKSNAILYVSSSQIIGEIVYKKLEAMRNSSKVSPEKMFQWVRILELGSRIQKNVVPACDEEAVRSMVSELKRIKGMKELIDEQGK